jgi:hypothetical protein
MSLILHKRSNVPAKAPSVADLTDGELSINTYDGRLFVKTTVDTVATITSFSSDAYYSSIRPTFSGQYGITIELVGTEVKIGNSQDLQTSASPAFSNLNVSGTTAATSTTTGALTIAGGVGVAGALYASSASIAGMQFSQYGSIFNDQAGNNQLFQASTNSLASGLGLWTAGGVNNAVYSSGGIAFMVSKTLRAGNYPTSGITPLTIGANGVLTVSTTAASTSTTNGALVVTGGVGIGGALNVGNGLKVTNNSHTWEFNSDGNIVIPDGGSITYSNGTSIGGGGGGGSAGGGSITPTTVKTSSYAAADNQLVRCNSTSSSFTITMPAAPADGAIVGVLDVYTTFANFPVTVVPSIGHTIEKDSVGFELDINGTYITFMYNSINLNWRVLETPFIHADSNSLIPTGIVVSNTNAAIYDLVRCNTTAGGFSVYFPLLSIDGTVIGIIDTNNTFASYPVLLIPSQGTTIEDQPDSYELSISGMFVSFIFIQATNNWRLLNAPSSGGTTGGTGTGTELPSQTGNSGKLLKTNGSTLSWAATTGTGTVVLASSPTLIAPNLGTPITGSLINCTGYLYSSLAGTVTTWNQNTTGTAAGLSETLEVIYGGTGATTLNGMVRGNGPNAFTVAVAGTDFVEPSGDLGTPSTGVLTNCTGYTFANLASKPTTASGFGIADAVTTSMVGAVNGVAPLGIDARIPAAYLPSYVDDAVESDNLLAFPATGETGKIYVAKDTNKIYRWTGTVYVEISPTAGNADSATKLFTARTISTTGDAAWTVTFDGSANANGVIRLANIVTAGSASKVTYNAKGLITSSSALSVSDISDISTTYQSKSSFLSAVSALPAVASTSGIVRLTSGIASIDSTVNVVFNGALGKPTTGDLSNCTGYPYSAIAGTIPLWNQDTIGTAAGLSVTLVVGSGGTGVQSLTGIVKGNGSSAFSAAVAGTDYQLPIGTISGMVKGNGTNLLTAAVADTDYLTPPSGTAILKANSSGALANAVAGTDYQIPIGTISGMVKGNGTNLVTAATAGTDYVAPDTATTFTAKQSFTGSASVLSAVFSNITEVATINAVAITGAINYETSVQSVIYNTTAAAGNWTLNFRHSSTTSLNAAMSIGQSVTVAFLATSGATDRYNTAITIDGVAITPKWQSGAAPASGSPNAVDIYTYTIIKTADATFTVFSSVTKFA